jgi:hypothetical protein
VVGLGRKTLSGILCSIGQQHQDWTAHYRLYSKRRIDIEQGFRRLLQALVQPLPRGAAVTLAMDDTIVRKRGKKIAGVGYLRDPLGPPFQTNLVRAQRLVQVSASLSEGEEEVSRMIPVLVRDAAPVKKPGKRATDEQWKEYHRLKKERNLSKYGVQCLHEVRKSLDELGEAARMQWVSVDGGHTNGNVLRDLPERTAMVGRIRKDAKLHYLPPQNKTGVGRNRIYGELAPTPEQLRKDETVQWQPITIRCNGRKYSLRIKDINNLRWPVAGEQLLHLIVIAPLGYRLTKHSKISYRDPVYLICTDPNLSITDVLKIFLKRWDIEVNFRDEKTLLGTGQAQVRNPYSVAALPQMSILSYAALLLASVKVFGVGGKPSSIQPPKWYNKACTKLRASTNDLIAQMRYELWAKVICPDDFHDFAECKCRDTKPGKLSLPLESALFYATG